MFRIEQPEIFGFNSQEQVTARSLIDRVSLYIQNCPEVFSSKNTSLALLTKIKNTGIFSRLDEIEARREHFPLSHAMMVTYFTANVSRQINALSLDRLGCFIVDEPLLVTSALLHDIGKVINDEDIERLGLKGIDLKPYTACFPLTASSTLIESNDILKTIALILSFGEDYSPFAKTNTIQ